MSSTKIAYVGSFISIVCVRHSDLRKQVHVFQTLPFLEASRQAFISSREFVNAFLPLRQTRSPKLLDEPAESGLNQEIDTDEAKVVRGDGSDSMVDRTEFVRDADHALNVSTSELTGKADEEEPSWMQSPMILPTPPLSSDEDEQRSPIASSSSSKASHVHYSSRLPKLPRAPSLQQLRSTISVIADASSFTHRSRAHSHHELFTQ